MKPLCLSPGNTHQLSSLGQATYPLWALVSSTIKEDNHSSWLLVNMKWLTLCAWHMLSAESRLMTIIITSPSYIVLVEMSVNILWSFQGLSTWPTLSHQTTSLGNLILGPNERIEKFTEPVYSRMCHDSAAHVCLPPSSLDSWVPDRPKTWLIRFPFGPWKLSPCPSNTSMFC